MSRFKNFTPPTLGSELSTSEITMVEELTALANSGTGEFIRKSAGSLVNATLSETIALSGLSDVAITSGTQGDILYYNGTSWVNLAAGTSGTFLQTQGSGANPQWVENNNGTVTSVSVVTANGVSGTVATATTTPAITLTLGAITPTSVDVGGTTLLASRALTIDTGGVFNIVLSSAAGDDFTVNTNALVVEGDTGRVGIGTATPVRIFNVREDQNDFSQSLCMWNNNSGTASTSEVVAGSNVADAVHGVTSSGFTGNRYGVTTASTAFFANTTANPIVFSTNSLERVNIGSSGGVGITQYLQVGGSAPAGFASQGDGLLGNSTNYLGYDNSEATVTHRGVYLRLERTSNDPHLLTLFDGTPTDETKVRIFELEARAKNSIGDEVQYGVIDISSFDVTAGTEEGIMEFFVVTGGVPARSHLKLAYDGDVFNEDAANIDVRVEGVNKPNCLLLDASDDEIAIDGRFSLVALTPAQITADQNDYNPESTATNRSSFWRLSTDAARTITGIANGLDGRVLILANVGGFDVVLANQNASSVAGNRIITGTGADVTVAADTSVKLIYDNTTARWRVL